MEVSSRNLKRKIQHLDNGARVQQQFKNRLVAERERSFSYARPLSIKAFDDELRYIRVVVHLEACILTLKKVTCI